MTMATVPTKWAHVDPDKPHGYHRRKITHNNLPRAPRQDNLDSDVCDVCGASRWNPTLHPGQRHIQ